MNIAVHTSFALVIYVHRLIAKSGIIVSYESYLFGKLPINGLLGTGTTSSDTLPTFSNDSMLEPEGKKHRNSQVLLMRRP